MTDPHGILREISWRDLCPWLVLFRSARLACSLAVLVLGTFGALLTPIGWRVSQWCFLDNANAPHATSTAVLTRVRSWPWESPGTGLTAPGDRASTVADIPGRVFLDRGSPTEVYQEFTRPVAELFALRPTTASQAAYLVGGSLWSLAVWSLLGGAITRIGVMAFGREEKIGLRRALAFARRRWRSYLIAPLFPLIGVAALTVPCLFVGLLLRLDVGVLIMGILWLIVLLAAFPITMLLVGLGFGWPLMWATISAEEDGDEFAAMQHSFSYTFQRPWHLAAYILLATFIGVLANLVFHTLAEQVVQSAAWAVSWGSGHQRLTEVVQTTSEQGSSGPLLWGARAIQFWNNLALSVVSGFRVGFFWLSASAIYLLLRQQVDRTEFDEIYCEDAPRPVALADLPVPTPGSPSGASAGTPSVAGTTPAGSEAPQDTSSRGEAE